MQSPDEDPKINTTANVGSYYAAIVESSDDAIVSKDLNGIIRSWNSGAQRIFGYAPVEIIGKSVTILIPSGHRDEESNILSRIRRGEKIDHYETVRQRKDGTHVMISLSVSPIRDSKGNIIGASKIARDITKQIAADQAIEAARQEMSRLNAHLEQKVLERTASLNEAVAQMEEFSYSVSHDLRSPLRAMQAYANVLLEDHCDQLDATGVYYLQKIIRSSARMDKLILDVLVYTRIARGQIETRPIDLDLHIREIIEQYPGMQPPKAEIILQKLLGQVLAHDSLLTQALSNVLGNAVKFVAPGTVPRIQIISERRGDYLRLIISDNGIGIKPEFKSRIFGMFERGEQENAFEGTGIGLAIARKAVEKMGGAIGVDSDGKTGTSIWVDLPEAP